MSEAPGGGSVFFIENPRRGGEAGRGHEARRVSVVNWGIFGGGGGNFFFGAEMSTKIIITGNFAA